MKKINARFNSICAETGVKIKKGDEMYYDYSTKKCYTLTSEAAKRWESEWETRSTAAMVRAQEDAYWDNVTGGYYSSHSTD